MGWAAGAAVLAGLRQGGWAGCLAAARAGLLRAGCCMAACAGQRAWGTRWLRWVASSPAIQRQQGAEKPLWSGGDKPERLCWVTGLRPQSGNAVVFRMGSVMLVE